VNSKSSRQKSIAWSTTAAEQQLLLRRLDETDDGWRCLALGFVEAQTWGT